MLSYALAIAVAISSLAFFTTAFLMSDIHRQDDFLWSGVGLFYALILWFCARNITGAVLLGQAAATTLLVSYSWQTLKLRKAAAHPERAVEINNFSVLRSANKLLKRDRPTTPAAVKLSDAAEDKVTSEIAIPDAPTKSTVAKPKKSGGLGRFFGKKQSTITNTKLAEILVDEPVAKQPKPEPKSAAPSPQPTANVTKPAPTSPETKLESAPTSKPKTVQPDATIKEPTARNTEVAKPEQPTVVVKEAATSKPETVQPDATIKEPTVKNTEVAKPEQPTVEIEEVNQVEVAAVTQPVEAKTSAAETTIAESPQPEVIKSETKPEPMPVKEASPQPKVTIQPELAKAEEPPQPEVTPEASNLPNQESEKSALDALETVEVAEVLDAVPDENYGDRDLDKANIIEVTTTEINITTEVKQIDLDDESTQGN